MKEKTKPNNQSNKQRNQRKVGETDEFLAMLLQRETEENSESEFAVQIPQFVRRKTKRTLEVLRNEPAVEGEKRGVEETRGGKKTPTS